MHTSPLLISYLALRRCIGILGTALPLVLSIGALVIFSTDIQTSLSRYYHTDMGDVFVGTLCAIGVFLFSYKGYVETGSRDNVVGNLAGVFAVGTALFATDPASADTIPTTAIGTVHVLFAGLFFLSLAYFCLCLFTKSDPDNHPTEQKLKRNRVYRISGWTILASVLLIGVQAALPMDFREALRPYHPVYWLESIAVIVFGIS